MRSTPSRSASEPQRSGRPPDRDSRRQRPDGLSVWSVSRPTRLGPLICLRGEFRRCARPSLGSRLSLPPTGPDGWLLTPMHVGYVTFHWFAAQAVLVVALGVTAGAYAWSLPGSGLFRRLVWGLLLTNVIHALPWDEHRWLALFLLLCLLGLHREDRLGIAASAFAGLLAGFYLLMKVSLGAAGLPDPRTRDRSPSTAHGLPFSGVDGDRWCLSWPRCGLDGDTMGQPRG